MLSFRSSGARDAVRHIRTLAVLLALSALLTAACAERRATDFSLDRAGRHVDTLGTGIGCRPTGTEANARARAYLVAELRRSGFVVTLQEGLATTPSGRTTPVVNIIAVKKGQQPEAVALVSHYDSPPESRGAADDGLGVAVCLEAGRVLGQRANPRYTLVVALTDGEELGLLGARLLRSAPEFAAVKTFLNFEAVGTSGPARLFQVGPANPWLARVWASAAASPVGSSLYTTIYDHLPNDTDYTVLVAHGGPPGLNFAPTGNTFAYHTPLDTPARLDQTTLADLGHDTVRIVTALDAVNINERSAETSTMFDVAGRFALVYSNRVGLLVALAACLLGCAATVKAYLAARDEIGLLRVFVTVVWAIVGLAAAIGAMIALVVGLRAFSGLNNPWYARSVIFPVCLDATGIAAAWLLLLVARVLPTSVGPCGRPACVWLLTLPVWTLATGLAQRYIPGTTYLVALPLIVASVLVIVLPMRRDGAGRLASLLVLFVSAVLWLPLTGPLFEFLVGLFGSLPIAAPAWLFPAAAVIAGFAVLPPLAGVIVGRERHLAPASLISSVLVLTVAGLIWTLFVEPPYTGERPERRTIRYVQDMVQRKAVWEIGTHERDSAPAGVRPGAPEGWQADAQAPAVSLTLGPVSGVFRYRTRAADLVVPPLDVTTTVTLIEGTTDSTVDVRALPRLEGTGVVFALPWQVTPAEPSLPGVVQNGRWQAVVMPAPAEGITLRVRLSASDVARWPDARIVAVAHGVPGGVGWQRLPSWLRQDTVVWNARSYFILPWPAPTAATQAVLAAPARQQDR